MTQEATAHSTGREIAGYESVFHEIKASFIRSAEFAGIQISDNDILVDFIQQSDHKPPARLPQGKLAIYVFMIGDRCLKVGKAGSKSAARFCSQHYGLKAPSTLAKSIIKYKEKFSIEDIDEHNVKSWICQNTYRVNYIMPIEVGPFILSLFEAFVQCCLKPEFEGFLSQKLESNLFFTKNWFNPHN